MLPLINQPATNGNIVAVITRKEQPMKIKKARRLAKNIMFANAIVTDLGTGNVFRPAVGFNQDVLNSAACVLHEAGICDKEDVLRCLHELADEISKESGQWLLNEFAKEERQHLH